MGVHPRARANGEQGPSPAPSPLNMPPALASNQKERRAKEAEEDRVLIASAQAGDMGAFRHLVERHQRRAFAVAFALVRDENDARELVQEAFLRAYKSLPAFEGGSSFFTWLYRIVTNLSIDLMRRAGRRTTDLDEGRLDLDEEADLEAPFLSRLDGADPVDIVRRREIAARLQTALDALPSYHRAVIVMREIDGMSYEEIAQAMSVSKGTIMSRLFHARQKLQRALADCYKEQVGNDPPRSDAPPSEQASEPLSLSRETMMELMALADGELEGEAEERAERLAAQSEEARQVVASMRGPSLRVWLDGALESRRPSSDGIADAVMARLAAAEGAAVRVEARRTSRCSEKARGFSSCVTSQGRERAGRFRAGDGGRRRDLRSPG